MSEDYAQLKDKPDLPALPVMGCVDGGLRLIAADPALARLQREAGARLGARLAVAPLADIVRLARKLGIPVTREAHIADAEHRYDILVTATPEDEVVRLCISDWKLAETGPAFDQAPETLDDTLASPLGQIIDAAEGISAQADGPLQENYADYGNDIAAAGRHLLSVIHTMSEQVSGRSSEEIDLGEVAKEAAQIVKSAASKRDVSIKVNSFGAPGMVLGQRGAALQILVNILGNAVRHSPAGGCVRIDFKAGDGIIETRISDTGPGIAPIDRLRIFEAFERAHDAEDGGKGLGLAISRRLARGMGGDVLMGDQPKQGACFRLRLPAA
ncbi:sensor histidine kinase [Sphingomicrobium marinum]|uniref:sensor histidine kinase n=1 Tax=Sphingomicrobium marinum TaxID=1227950 RepID=UPI0022404FA8|nr:HAMP domain-containing sensor histidine kinase [Sphingomicrobium marinum]